MAVKGIGKLFGNAYLLLILAPLFWGGNAVAGKLASHEWLPLSLTCLRWFIVFLVLLPFSWKHLRTDWPVLRKNILVLFLLGGLGMSCFNMSMYVALNYTSAINVGIEQAAMPVFIMLLNFMFLGQRVVHLQILGLILATVGVVVTATHGQPSTFFSGGLNRGDLLMILGSLFYAGYSFGLRWRPDVHWLSFLAALSVTASITALPFAAWELNFQDMEFPSAGAWLVIAYVVIFPSILGQLFFARGVELIGANRAGLFINLVPVFGALLAVLVIGEQFRWYHGFGLTLVLAGILLAERTAKK